jgi:hypothetical protein
MAITLLTREITAGGSPTFQTPEFRIPTIPFWEWGVRVTPVGRTRAGTATVRVMYKEGNDNFWTWFYAPTVAFSGGNSNAVKVILGKAHNSFIWGAVALKPPTFRDFDEAAPTYRGVSNQFIDETVAKLKIDVLNAQVLDGTAFRLQVTLNGGFDDIHLDARRIEEVPAITRQGLDMAATMAAANRDGNSFSNTGREVVSIRNTSASAVVVRPVVGPVESFPSENVGDAVTVAALSGHAMVGPYPIKFNDDLGRLNLQYSTTAGDQLASAAGLSIGVCRLQRPFSSRDV